MRILNAPEAIRLIGDGDTIAISGGGYRVVPEALLRSLSAAAADGNGPKGLTAIAIAWLERGVGGKGGDGTGLNLLAVPGLLSRIISGSFSRSRTSEMGAAIRANEIAAYNYPMGSMVQWLRASAAGRSGLITTVGLDTFVDPRIEGGVVNTRGGASLSRIIEVEGQAQIFYPALKIDVSLVKASAADSRGNLYLDREAFDHGVQDVALAGHHNGGLVIAQVDRLVEPGEVHPRFGRIPGGIVDVVVVVDDAFADSQDPALTGDDYSALAPAPDRLEPRDAIARIVVDLLPDGAMVNLGAGIPMYDVPEAARRSGRNDIYFTVEQGPMGGWPKAGGVSRHPGIIMPQLDVFDFYEGGGPDVSILSFGQVGRNGDVNVSRFADLMPGCGGFPNIVHGARRLIFCGTLTTGQLDEVVGGGRLHIRAEGQIDRFVDVVEQITFAASNTLARGTRVTIVTDRGVLELDADGFVLTSIAPGIDLEADVRAHIPFPIRIASTLAVIDESFYS